MRNGMLMIPLAAALLAAACSSSGGEEASPTPIPPLITLGVKELPAAATNWDRPTGLAVTDDSIWVLDGGRDRVLHLGLAGEFLGTLCERDECQFALKNPLGLDVHGDRLYVANSGGGSVVVLTFDGNVVQTLDIPAGRGGPAIPADVVVAAGGDFYVSDVGNNRILHLDALGNFAGSIETTNPDDPKYRLLRPQGLALDDRGDLYVADAADGRAKRYSPQGRFLEEYMMLENPSFSSPQDVVVGSDGTVYFSDAKRSIVQTFDSRGEYLGIVGLVDASRIDSTGALSSPYGLFIKGDRLYVTDLAGALFAFQIDPQYWTERATLGRSGQ